MDTDAVRVVILGGGTAGWITAAAIASEHPEGARVLLVESPDVPIIGVGEGTWPSMRRTLQRIGLSEAHFLSACDASLKQGTEFRDWCVDGEDHRYHHPFSMPSDYGTLNLADYWLAHAGGARFADFVTPQASVIRAARAPKSIGTPEYAFQLNYGYHLDAGRFAGLLAGHARSFPNLRHVLGNLQRVESRPDGEISALWLDTGERIEGDLFVDCTGQHALLIGQHFGESMHSVRDILPNNRALAVQVPYPSEVPLLPSATISTAQAGGWIWDIGLQSRRGIGYVHSADHVTEDGARDALDAYLRHSSPGIDAAALVFRMLRFEPGYRSRAWRANCVAVGLAAGFVEPLEASSIALVEQAAWFIAENLPRDPALLSVVAARFNRKMGYHWERIVEFLKLHYVLSRRTDSAYWHDCREASSIPDSLAEKLQLWEQQAPWHEDAPRIDELFPSASYQYVLYGMDFRPRLAAVSRRSHAANFARADRVLRETRDAARRLAQGLPDNRQLLAALTGSAAPRGASAA